jgi:FAD/FMN-containing dehydrogenase
MGWNCRGWGWAAEQMVGIDVVTADGLSIHCNESSNADLFWAARGSGPGFPAIVTQFHLQTMPLPSGMLSNTYSWNISEFDTVMAWVIETSRIADSSMEIIALALYPDNSNNATLDQPVQIVVHVLTFKPSVESARAALDLISSGVPLQDKATSIRKYHKTSLSEQFLQQHKMNPEGHRYCADNAWIHSHLPTQKVVDAMRDVFTSLPSPQSFALYVNLAPERPLPEMAMSMQTEHWMTLCCIWKDAKDDVRIQGWVRSRFENIDEKVSPGLYLGDSDFQVRKAPFMEEGKREKLENVRRKWDSQGMFCGYLGLENE